MTTDDVSNLGARLIVADRTGDTDEIRSTAYLLLAGLSEEHARAASLANCVHSLSRNERHEQR